MLERVTDFHAHPELLHGSVRLLIKTQRLNTPRLPIRAGKLDSPEDRFIQVLRYYLAGWHIKPKGVKKPCVSSSRCAP